MPSVGNLNYCYLMKLVRPFLLLTFLRAAVSAYGALPALPNDNYTDWAVFITIGEKVGSGFIMQASNSVYIVTARHVLFDDTGAVTNWHLWSTRAVVKGFHTISNAAEPSSWSMELNVAALLARGELRYSIPHDVALGRFEDCNPTNPAVVSIDETIVRFTSAEKSMRPFPASATKKLKQLVVGSDVVAFGFPSSIGLDEAPQIDRSLPLLRKGMIAGVNRSRETVILDLPVYGGDSGGPVMLRESDGITFCAFYMIGVQTQFVPFREIGQNVRFHYFNQNWANSGYSVAEPLDAVLDMVWK